MQRVWVIYDRHFVVYQLIIGSPGAEIAVPRGGGKYFSRVTTPIPDLGHLDVGEAGTTIDRCIALCPSHSGQWWTHVSGMFNLATFHAHAGGGAHHCHVGRFQVTQQCD